MDAAKVYPSKYLTPADIKKPATVTINHLTLEEFRTDEGTKESKPVIYFQKATKGMIVNKSGWKLLAKMFGNDTDKWIGKQLTLFVTQVDAFGKQVDAIRFRIPDTLQPKEEEAPEEVLFGEDPVKEDLIF